MEEKYNILCAQMTLSKVSRSALSRAIGIHYNTLCRKMRGENAFTVEEAVRIKQVLGSALPVEELFRTEDNGACS